MRLHITLDDELVRDFDRVVGERECSGFIARAVRRAIDELDRAEALEAALGSITDSGHDWDVDPAAWVRAQRADRGKLAGHRQSEWLPHTPAHCGGMVSRFLIAVCAPNRASLRGSAA